MNEWSANVAHEFFLSGTRRINRLVFELERHTDASNTGATGGFLTICKSYSNPNPRFPCNMDYIFETRGDATFAQMLLEDAIENAVAAAEFVQRTRKSEFYEWVDSFHDAEQ